MNAQNGRALTQAACFNHVGMCELLIARGAQTLAINEALCSACIKVCAGISSVLEKLAWSYVGIGIMPARLILFACLSIG